MAKILNFKEFLDQSYEKREIHEVLRVLELSGTAENNSAERYAIQITFEDAQARLLVEHKVYNSFARTNNRYAYHPADLKIPVKAHYHIYPPNGKTELYAVNTDGTAHHKKHRGFQIPSKEADELRAIGVTIPATNIIESLDFLEESPYNLITEGIDRNDFSSIFIVIG